MQLKQSISKKVIVYLVLEEGVKIYEFIIAVKYTKLNFNASGNSFYTFKVKLR